jgi:hypothetical protein
MRDRMPSGESAGIGETAIAGEGPLPSRLDAGEAPAPGFLVPSAGAAVAWGRARPPAPRPRLGPHGRPSS